MFIKQLCSDSTPQNDIQNPIINISSPYVSDQESSKVKLNWRKDSQELEDDLESNNGFNNYLESTNGFISRLKSDTEFENCFGNNNEFANRLGSSDEFENELGSDDLFENESINYNEIEESNYRIESGLESDTEFKSDSKSNDNDSCITDISSTTFEDNEESIPFIPSEVAVIIRLFKIKVQNNLTDEVFQKGVECSSANCKDKFILHGCVLSWSGDMPALTKLMGLTGHNSYSECRYCNIVGIYSSHVYYPTKPPRGKEGKTYDPANLPLRTHNEFKRRIQEIQTKSEQNQAISELRKIKEHFSTTSDVSGLQLISFSRTGTKYGRLRTKDGHYIGSKWICRNKDWSRVNYTVMVKIEVDIYVNYLNRLLVFKVQDFYAIVEYYLVYEFEESKVMLAYIQ
ncbi:9608_t:CDS:2 [Dentiscutata erythropus]|uniref:9608_t:CDS:1 n=1 Tax=Dentiscutata erythropus TaxID=1348616 RepID=A0A9N9G1M1_9GLOM|nr:9608_t:CDS:2 [Dentiscutata erythropus]